MDYQYWNDPSDEFKEKEGTLLPLFTFQIEQYENIYFNKYFSKT